LSERTRHLVALQQVDDEAHAAEAELAGIPARRAAAEARVEAAEAELEAARARLAAAEQEQRRHEAALQDKEVQHSRLESQQTQVKTNEAYRALLSEMEQCKAAIAACEDGILEAMDAIETARAALAGAEEAAAAARAESERELRELGVREGTLAERLEGLRGQREAARGRLDAPVLAQYDRVTARRRPGIAVVRNETCQGCRVSIPPQAVVELRRGERLITCGHCQRILLHEQDAAAAAPPA